MSFSVKKGSYEYLRTPTVGQPIRCNSIIIIKFRITKRQIELNFLHKEFLRLTKIVNQKPISGELLLVAVHK